MVMVKQRRWVMLSDAWGKWHNWGLDDEVRAKWVTGLCALFLILAYLLYLLKHLDLTFAFFKHKDVADGIFFCVHPNDGGRNYFWPLSVH